MDISAMERVSASALRSGQPRRCRLAAASIFAAVAVLAGCALLLGEQGTLPSMDGTDGTAELLAWSQSPEVGALQATAEVLRSQIHNHLGSQNSGAQRVRVAELASTEHLVREYWVA